MEINPFDFNHRKSSHSRSYNEKYSSTPMYPRHNTTTTSTRRRNMPITSTPYADMVSCGVAFMERSCARAGGFLRRHRLILIFSYFSYVFVHAQVALSLFDSQLNKNEKHDLTLIIRYTTFASSTYNFNSINAHSFLLLFHHHASASPYIQS